MTNRLGLTERPSAGAARASTVADVFGGAGRVLASEPVRWGTPVPEHGPGVYIMALIHRPEVVEGTLRACPVDGRALDGLLAVCPELLLDARMEDQAHRPTARELGQRLGGFWLADETVLYIGRSKRPLVKARRRVLQAPPRRVGKPQGRLAAQDPAVLDELWVHWAATADYMDAEKGYNTLDSPEVR